MKISELLQPTTIVADLKAKDKDGVLAELTDAVLEAEPNLNRSTIIDVLRERENLGSTGIGDGVAIPHGKLKNLDKLLLSFGRSRTGVDFDSMDGKLAHLFFLLVAPEDSVGVHLKTLARISKLLKDPSTRRQLLDAADADELFRIITTEEEKV